MQSPHFWLIGYFIIVIIIINFTIYPCPFPWSCLMFCFLRKSPLLGSAVIRCDCMGAAVTWIFWLLLLEIGSGDGREVSEQCSRGDEPAVASASFPFYPLLLLESPGSPTVTPLTAQVAWRVIERGQSWDGIKDLGRDIPISMWTCLGYWLKDLNSPYFTGLGVK